MNPNKLRRHRLPIALAALATSAAIYGFYERNQHNDPLSILPDCEAEYVGTGNAINYIEIDRSELMLAIGQGAVCRQDDAVFRVESENIDLDNA